MRKLLLLLLLSFFLVSFAAWAMSPVFLHQVVSSDTGSFPSGWGRKCSLSVNASKIPSDQTNFPVLLTLATLPSEMFDADGSYPALSGGGDIRFSSDGAGNTRLSCDLVTFTIDNDPANGVAEIHVKVPSVNGTVDTTFYVWYDKDGQSQPATDAAYGSESVWDNNFKLVQHMNEDPSGSSPQMIDSTSNDNDGTSNGTMTSGDLVAGKIGKALVFDGTDDLINVGSKTSLDNLSPLTFSTWLYPTNASDGDIMGKYPIQRQLAISSTNDRIYFIVDGGTDLKKFGATNSTVADTWQHFVVTWDGGTAHSGVHIYKNGTELSYDDEQNGASFSDDASSDFVVGNQYDGLDPFTGTIDEVRASNLVRTSGWIETEYNNQHDPSTFVTEGTPE